MQEVKRLTGRPAFALRQTRRNLPHRIVPKIGKLLLSPGMLLRQCPDPRMVPEGGEYPFTLDPQALSHATKRPKERAPIPKPFFISSKIRSPHPRIGIKYPKVRTKLRQESEVP